MTQEHIEERIADMVAAWLDLKSAGVSNQEIDEIVTELAHEEDEDGIVLDLDHATACALEHFHIMLLSVTDEDYIEGNFGDV